MRIVIVAYLLFAKNIVAMELPLRCQSESFYAEEKSKCILQKTSSISFDLDKKLVSLGMYSVTGEDKNPIVLKRKKRIDFIANPTGVSVTGEKVDLSMVGQVFSDGRFIALSEEIYYKGKCKSIKKEKAVKGK